MYQQGEYDLKGAVSYIDWSILIKFSLLIVPLAYFTVSVSKELQYRNWIVEQQEALSRRGTVTPPLPRFDPGAILIALGLPTENKQELPSVLLTLKANFVSSKGESRALLEGTNGERVYQVGERLPGGGVLRRVEAHRAVLWNKGREEVLTLQTSDAKLLRHLSAPTDALTPASSAHFLRSIPKQPE